MDTLITMLAAAGLTFQMGIPGADDIMLNYQSTSFHDAWYVREVFDRRPAPEFEAWLASMRIVTPSFRLADEARAVPMQRSLEAMPESA
jgi:ethanolamine ammonia-lyase large subunit